MRSLRALDLALVGCIVGCLFLVLTFGYGRDQGIYAVVARGILDGQMPYRDVWDFKPPGIYLVYALVRAAAGSPQWGIRAFEVMGLALTARGLVILARQWFGEPRIGLLAAALAMLVHAQLDFWHTAQPESFGGMLTVWGLVAGTRPGSRRRQLGWWVVAGVAFGCAGLLKPPLAGGGAVLALVLAGQRWLAQRRSAQAAAARPLRALGGALLPIGAILLGGVLPFAWCGGWFVARGAWGALVDTLFVFTPHYTALGWQGRTLLDLYYQAWSQWFVFYSSLLAAGLLLFVAWGPRLWRRRGIGLLFGVIAIQLLGVALQGKFFPYHYGSVWPVTALVAALGWWELGCRAARWSWVGRAGVPLLFVLVAPMGTATKDLADSFWERSLERLSLFLVGPRDAERVDRLASVADVDAGADRALAELVRQEVAPARPVFIWGFEPVVYDRADRPASSRYIYNVPQRVDWAAESSRAELMADLRAAPPALFVVAHHDLIPMVTGDYLDSAAVLQHFAELRSWLDERYVYLARVQDFDVYVASSR